MRLLTLKTVLVATDLSDNTLDALRTGQQLATAAGGALHVAHASASDTALEPVHEAANKAGLELDDASVHGIVGEPAQAVNQLANELGVDVIVLGRHQDNSNPHGARTLGTGQLSLITNATAPCLIVVSALRLPIERVVVAVDLSDTSRGAFVIALSWASALRAHGRGGTPTTSLTALHVCTTSSPDAERTARDALETELTRVRADAGEWAGISIDSAVTSNADASAGIADYATTRRADLVVLGTRGCGSESGVGGDRLGSVSSAATQQMEMPTLLVPPAVWKRFTSDASGRIAQGTDPDRDAS